MFKMTTKGFDSLVLDDSRLKPAAKLIGKRSAKMIYDRVARQGRDAHGKRLPKVEPNDKGWFYTSVQDFRFKSAPKKMIFREFRNADMRQIYPDGYEKLKKEMTGKAHVGAPLTGDMWRSLKIAFKKGRGDALVIRVYFSGKSTVAYEPTKTGNRDKPKRVKVSNNAKAHTLQFRKRPRAGRGKDRIFRLMELSESEKGMIQSIVKSALKFRG